VPTVSQHASVALAYLLQQPRRALHIGEEQCERSSRKFGHRGPPRLSSYMRRLACTGVRIKVCPKEGHTSLDALPHYTSSEHAEAKPLSKVLLAVVLLCQWHRIHHGPAHGVDG
jgi:hypothetical protein